MNRERLSIKFLIVLTIGLILLFSALALYDLGGQKFLKGTAANGGIVPMSGYEAYFLLAIITAPVGCILTLAGIIGVFEKLLPRGED